MKVIRSKSALNKLVSKLKSQGKKIAFVPTMGALHEGHLSLMRAARAKSKIVIASIFVNPTQFSASEDYGKYPRTEREDIAKLKKEKVSFLYLPRLEDIYPEDFASGVLVANNHDILCGITRPHHFHGVALVVSKLLNQTKADFAFFGEKDFQQLAIIKQTIKDLDIDCKIIGCPIKREEDGLAMSSRNRYLKPMERKIAPKLFEILRKAKLEIKGGAKPTMVLANAKRALRAAGFSNIDYIELRAEKSLERLEKLKQGTAARLFAAVYLGKTRLIDNMKI
jgi:pantoate--beta-alanine ligase